jgi:hypothetical protein
VNSYNGFTAYQRTKAQKWLNQQWASFALAKPTKCCACGQDEGIMDAHAEDYSEPFQAGKTDAFHLCFRCHMMVHCRHRNKLGWINYKQAIKSGTVFAPFFRRDWDTFKNQMEIGHPIHKQGEPHEDILSLIG